MRTRTFLSVCVFFLICLLLLTGCIQHRTPTPVVIQSPNPAQKIQQTESNPAPELQQIEKPEGSASHGVISNKPEVAEARVVAETYWNAQKKSDMVMFKKVTPHETMSIVIDWTFVSESSIDYEEAITEPIKNHLRQIIKHENEYLEIKKTNSTDSKSLNEGLKKLEVISAYAKAIEPNYPLIGWLFKKGYWESIIPESIIDSSKYQLLHYTYKVDVKFQSKAGTLLHKRTSTELYRMKLDNYDSGWKVFFVVN